MLIKIVKGIIYLFLPGLGFNVLFSALVLETELWIAFLAALGYILVIVWWIGIRTRSALEFILTLALLLVAGIFCLGFVPTILKLLDVNAPGSVEALLELVTLKITG